MLCSAADPGDAWTYLEDSGKNASMAPLGFRILNFLAKETKGPLPRTLAEVPPPFDLSRGNPFAPIKDASRKTWRRPKYSLREQNELRREAEFLGWPEHVLPPPGAAGRSERTQRKEVSIKEQTWLDGKAREYIREQLMKHWASGSGQDAAREVGSSGGMPDPEQIRVWAEDVKKYDEEQARRDELFAFGDTRAAENGLLNPAVLDRIEQEVDPEKYAKLRAEALAEEAEVWASKTAEKNKRLALIRMWVDGLRTSGQLSPDGAAVPGSFFTSGQASQAAGESAQKDESMPQFEPRPRPAFLSVDPAVKPGAAHLETIHVPAFGPYKGRTSVSFKGKRSQRTRGERQESLRQAMAQIPQTVARFKAERGKK